MSRRERAASTVTGIGARSGALAVAGPPADRSVMRVFVSGATGFVGRHLVRALLAEGNAVVAVARPSPRADALAAAGVTVRHGDLRNAPLVRSAVAQADAVCHLATVRTGSSVDRLARDARVQAGYDADVEATRVLVEATAAERGRRFVYVSSAGVHGVLQRVPADEHHPIRPDTAHRAAKWRGEELVAAAHAAGRIEAVVLRPTSIYGPGDERAGRFFRGVIDGSFRLVGDGRIPYHYSYVDDIVAPVLAALRVPDAAGAVLLAGAAQVPTLREFLEAIAAAAGVPLRRSVLPLPAMRLAAGAARTFLAPLGVRPSVIRDSEFFTLARGYDTSRAHALLGPGPQVPLAEGVRRTLAWVRGEASEGADRVA